MKYQKPPILILMYSLIVSLWSCDKDSEGQQILNITPEVEFSLAEGENFHQSFSTPFNAIISTPVFQNNESKIVNYALTHSFNFLNQKVSDINIQLNYTVDIFNGNPNLDSLFLIESKNNDIKYLIDQSTFMGFGLTLNLAMSDDSHWYSYQNYSGFNVIDQVDQSNADIDIYEVIELDTATYIKAKFHCNLYNENGDEMKLNEGNLTFRLN